jgi:hypothetical protein
MRLFRMVAVLGICAVVGSVAANAGVLEEKKNEWAFSLAAVDTDKIGTFTEYGFNWSWIFQGGYHELGVFISAFENDFDDPFFLDEDGSTIGPLYQWNWTPSKKATGVLGVGVGAVGGDLGDFFDSVAFIGVGVKAFIGNSAAINVIYQFEQMQGKDFIEDLDSSAITVGISIFTHKR